MQNKIDGGCWNQVQNMERYFCEVRGFFLLFRLEEEGRYNWNSNKRDDSGTVPTSGKNFSLWGLDQFTYPKEFAIVNSLEKTMWRFSQEAKKTFRWLADAAERSVGNWLSLRPIVYWWPTMFTTTTRALSLSLSVCLSLSLSSVSFYISVSPCFFFHSLSLWSVTGVNWFSLDASHSFPFPNANPLPDMKQARIKIKPPNRHDPHQSATPTTASPLHQNCHLHL